MMISILRQEIDSMIRAIYLLSVSDMTERKRLIKQTLDGRIWTVLTDNGKERKITDREMVELSNRLQGWTLSVYKFGCAFIHFSNFHDYNRVNPFDLLSVEEKRDILEHLRYYHGGPRVDNPDFHELVLYIPGVFDKISSNLKCYIKDIESNKVV